MGIKGRIISISAPSALSYDNGEIGSKISFVIYRADGKNELFTIESDEGGYEEISVSRIGDEVVLTGNYDDEVFMFEQVDNTTLHI